MVLPGGVRDGKVIDLSQHVLDQDTSGFIFGGPVEINGRNIRYTQDDDVDDYVCSVVDFSVASSGVVRVVLDTFMTNAVREKPIGAYYIRFRYEVDRPEDIVSQKVYGQNKRGAIFDLRVNDIRSWKFNLDEYQFIPIEKIYCFLVFPISHLAVFNSPSLKYSRILEKDHWKEYLPSCSGARIDGKHTIYYWKSDKTASKINPFRAFMHLQNEFGHWFLVFYLLGIAAPLTVSIINFFAR